MKRRMIAWVAVLCLIVRLLPTVAMAAEDEKMAGTTPNTPIVATGENGWLVESENGYMLYGISASKVAAWFKEHSDYNGQLYISAVISKDIDTIVPYAMTSMNTDLKADNGAVIDGHNSFTIVKVDFSKNEWIGLIGDHAFFNCSEMEGTLDLSASPIMMEIGDYAFYGCSKLSGTLCINTSYEYPLQTIGDYAFYGCTSLEGVDFSKVSNSGLKEIGDYAFYGCESLKTFIWPYYGEDTVIGDSAFENCTALRTMCKYGSEATGSKFELLPYIDEIGENAFKNCFAPEVKVKIPQSVKVIEKNAFSSDRISQIIVELDPNYVTEETYAGYDLTAFATGNDDLLIVLPNGKYFNKVYENGKLSADLRARIAYPTSITFKPDKNSDTGVKQEKLYNQSLCYEQQENGFWVYDENYALPEIPPDVSAGDKPKDGYTNEWIIDETGVILQHDSLLKGKEWVVSTQHLSASPTSETLAQPTIKFSMDGVALDDSELEYRYGVPVFKVPLDGEVHTVGVQVDHDLLQSKVDDNASEYVYFRYCWWDEQMWGKDGEGLRKYPLNGDRCDEVDSSNQRIFSKENPNWSLENDTVQFDRQETDYAEIPHSNQCGQPHR